LPIRKRRARAQAAEANRAAEAQMLRADAQQNGCVNVRTSSY
jgi:hypothetical protein